MILELYGSPGSGKSYILAAAIGKKEQRKENGIKQGFVTLIKKVSAYLPSSLMLKGKMMTVLGDECYRCVYFERPLSEYLNNICMLIFFYRILRNKELYMDEGYIQRITAMAVNLDIPPKKTMRLIKIIHDEVPFVQSVYLKTEIESCFVSIRNRNRHEVDMDEIDDENLKEFLKKYENYFSLISERYKHSCLLRGEEKKLKEIIYD